MSVPEEIAENDAPAVPDRSALVETIEAPRLEGVSTSDFVKFDEERTLYERKVKEKSDSTGVSIPLTTLRNSIEDGLLDAFIWSEWVPVMQVEEITEEHLAQCIKARSSVKPEDYDLSIINREIRSVRLPEESTSSKLETRVMSLCVAYNTKLKQCGYKNFIKEQPKLAVSHIMTRITHKKLKERLNNSKALRKEELEKDFGKFVRLLTSEARLIDRVDGHEKTQSKPGASSTEETAGSPGNQKRNRSRGWDKGSSSKADDAKSKDNSGGSHKRRAELPDCLLPRCSEKHYIRDCNVATIDEKKTLVAALREKRRKKGDKPKVGMIQSQTDAPDNTSLFSASYLNGAVEFSLMADQGSDVNVIPAWLLKELKRADPKLKVSPLATPRTFDNANTAAEALSCHQMVQADVELRIRHGEKLMLRGIRWLVCEQSVAYAYLGRHVLESLGLSNRLLLTAARDRLGGSLDVPRLLGEAGLKDDACADGATTVAAILEHNTFTNGSTFHDEGGAEEDQLPDSAVYVDLGEDDPAELETALRDLVTKAGSRHGEESLSSP